MSRFNSTTKNTHKITNYEGSEAYTLNPKMALYTAVCCSSLQPKFYTSTNDQIDHIRNLIGRVDPEFVCKLAIYAREKMYLRSIPLVLMVELAKSGYKGKILRDTVFRVIQRVDEITEILAYYQYANKRTSTKKLGRLSNAIKKGVADSFNKFEEYHFAKYNRDNEIKLRDALFLTHPKASDEEKQKIFDKIVNDTLEVPYTWEVELSRAGQEGVDKKKVWSELIRSKQMGYMATLRNLRNILDSDVPIEDIQQVQGYLSNPDAVRNSKQLPFRFFSAYKVLEGSSNMWSSVIAAALEEAVLHSIDNIKGFDENTSVLLACDVSGSMETPVSKKSSVHLYDIGLILACCLRSKCKAVITGIFGNTWKVKNVAPINILSQVSHLHDIEGEVGYSTNGFRVLDYLIQKRQKVDKIMFFTDCQLWDTFGRGSVFIDNWNRYKEISPESKLYLFDLSGYGNTPLNVDNKDVFLISGWSEKIFDVLNALECGGSALQEIEKV